MSAALDIASWALIVAGGAFCVIGAVSHDVRLDYDDELFVGVNVGMCGISTP